VLFVDIPAGTVHEARLDGDRVEVTGSRSFDQTVGAVAVAADGGLLVAGARALIAVDGDDVRRAVGPDVIPAGARRRLNDAACDPAGRFLVGSMALDDTHARDVLVRLDGDELTVLDDDLTLSNGLAWSPDGRLLYSIDSTPAVVWVRDYDVTNGAVGPRREWLRLTDGTPDGMCADAQGHLWIAVWGAGQVRRYDPDGGLVGVVDVPAPHTSCPAFVGPGLDRLLITTATSELTAEQRAAYPDSGRLFLADVGVTGQPATPWAG
jgi:sugar lactone lactonase YvrE